MTDTDIERHRLDETDAWSNRDETDAWSERNRVRERAKRATFDVLEGDDTASMEASGESREGGDSRSLVGRPGLVFALVFLGATALAVVVRRRRDSGDEMDDSHGAGGRSTTVPLSNDGSDHQARADADTGADRTRDETSAADASVDVGMEDETGYGSMTEERGQEYESVEDAPAPDEQADSEVRDDEPSDQDL